MLNLRMADYTLACFFFFLQQFNILCDGFSSDPWQNFRMRDQSSLNKDNAYKIIYRLKIVAFKCYGHPEKHPQE